MIEVERTFSTGLQPYKYVQKSVECSGSTLRTYYTFSRIRAKILFGEKMLRDN